MEAARFFGYTYGDWQREDPVARAKVMVHYLEHGMRESYSAEKAKLARKDAEPPQTVSGSLYHYRQGGGS